MSDGPVYDNALRLLAAGELTAVCRWLGIDADASCLRLAEALPAATMYVDLPARVGENLLAHVEFTSTPTPDMAQRMLEYRARIMRWQPGTVLTQYVVVLAGGTVPEQLVNGDDFAMRLHVVYLRDHEPADLLTDPALAPLAVLARAPDVAARARTLRSALEMIHQKAAPERRDDLFNVTTVLAAIHLKKATINEVGRETKMPIYLKGTIGGNDLEEEAEARGEARGEARALTRVLTSLLRHRFGDETGSGFEDLANLLAERHREGAVDLILSVTSLDELRRAT
jgi:hypothetical protein